MVRREPERFFDGDSLDPDEPVEISLVRVVERGRECFVLEHRIAYLDRAQTEPFVVPSDLATFRTDLASVPSFFAWLVPKSGVHLPAALVHDALVDPGTYDGPAIERLEADRVFRDAMGDLGTRFVRRWLMWTAVTLATVREGVGPHPALRRLAVFGTLAVIVVLGALATLDLLDLWDVLPWMGDADVARELLGGAAGAVVVPLVLAAAWGRLYVAGVIAGLALALLIHVTAVIVLLTACYELAERLLGWIDRDARDV